MMVNFPQAKKSVAWRQQEQKLHDDGVAAKVPGSGAFSAKGDNKGQQFLIQCKTTYKPRWSLTMDEWRKTKKDALKEDRMPVMQVQLEDREKFAIIDWDSFVEIVEQAGMKI